MEIAIVVRQPKGEDGVFKLFEVGTRKPVDPEAIKDRLEHIESKRKLARKLGLNGQIALLDKEEQEVKRPVLDMTPMSEEEVALWKAFLPTSYTVTPHSGHSEGYKYNYDKIPHPVLSKWADCVDEQVFERYEIWTPEARNIPDPVLVGYIGQTTYMIARWAESDSNLITTAGIKRHLIWKFLGPGPSLMVLTILAVLVPAVLGGIGTLADYGDYAKSLATWLNNALAFVPYGVAAFVVLTMIMWFDDATQRVVWNHTKASFRRKRK